MKSLRGHGHDRNSVQTYLNGILFLTYLLRISFSTTLRFALNRWDKSAGSVITAMKSMYERHGILLEVIADNIFKQEHLSFCEELGTSSHHLKFKVPTVKWRE